MNLLRKTLASLQLWSCLAAAAAAYPAWADPSTSPPAPLPKVSVPTAAVEQPCEILGELLKRFRLKPVVLPERIASDSVERQLDRWAEIEKSYYWNKGLDSELDYLRFIRRQDYMANVGKKHPTEIYGVDNYLAWKKAENILNSIPVGQLDITPELLSRTHAASTEALFPFLKKISRFLPQGLIPEKGGVFKNRGSFGRDPLFHPLNDYQYGALKANPWISGFRELPWPLSKAGARRGIISYSSAKEVQPRLQKLIEWYKAHKDGGDPVRVAAEFQYALVSIHPFVDGNGRLSRLMMDRILAEYGIPPPLLEDSSEDILLSLPDYVQKVREGVDEYLTVAELKVPSEPTGTLGKRINTFNQNPKIEKKVPGVSSTYGGDKRKILTLGGNRFYLTSDGFFYNNRGIPHALHDGKLYPIADRTYLLYELNGKVKMGKPSGMYPNGKIYRTYNEAQRDIFREHFKFLKAMEEKTVDPASIEIVSYAAISEANKQGRIYLYPWQKGLLENVVKSQSDDPFLILSRTRTAKTTFEYQGKADAYPPSEVVAQYERMDQQFWEYLQAAKQTYPELLPTVEAERRKLHEAARKFLQPYFQALAELAPHDRAEVEKAPGPKLLRDYLQTSKLNYPTYEEGIRALGDDSLVVLRSDSSMAGWVGFRSQQDYTKIAKLIPGYEKVRAFIRELNAFKDTPAGRAYITKRVTEESAKAQKKEGFYRWLPESLSKKAQEIIKTFDKVGVTFIQSLDKNILVSPFDNRGTDWEFQRRFLDFYLHASNAGAKAGKSFTTRTQLLTGFRFVNENVEGSIFAVRIPRKMAYWNFGTENFKNEYEILTTEPLSRNSIVHSYTRQDLEKTSPTPLKVVSDFQNKFDLK